MGDFHTLVIANGCNCVDPINSQCEGKTCNGGSNLYAFGFNIHGQCDGVPSEGSILIPKIVPWFHVNGKTVTNVAARRSRSIAITSDNEVFEWGFVGSEGTQFMKIADLPGSCKDV
jgi:hypothetical protein